ncbi:BCCT family transporter [Mangrovimonas sp. DI 80]|uniref:BCCT family transporter n=1 Tax=Mangrovimonas sp. DI 80 TaxID=1779330 RepID=UPI00097577D5|nr:BCCT family transporter [Mangrovimonas sp. DI 80]OMP30519.1 choline transporter [Mangrovimonas sp. DI 80]
MEHKKKKKPLFNLYYPVTIPATLIILGFVLVTLIVGEPIERLFEKWRDVLYDKVGWLFIITVSTMLVMSIIIAFGPFGRIRLGGPKAVPDYSDFSWYSMLFSAGMGIGLIFYGVAEPIQHLVNPPIPVATEAKAAEQAFKFTFLHYGFHPWAVYAMVSLGFAFFTFNRKLPLSVRSLFFPVLKHRINGWFGHVVDVLAVIACLFGLATTLGFGASQIGSGLNYLWGIPNTTYTHVIFIIVATVIASFSIASGLDKGVKALSVFNIRLTLVFMVVMLFIGPSVFIIDSLIENIGNYLQNAIQLGTYTEVYSNTKWQNNWTIFYWAWWIAWSPFVGIFIARVSKGRTIREFLTGVILIPSAFSFLWFTVFGSSAVYLELNGLAPIGAEVDANISTALFAMLGAFPLSKIMSFVGVLLLVSFFVTSSDSGSLVVDFITSGGKMDSPVLQRLFWAALLGLLAATLLIGGGLVTLQTAVMLAALPFSLILLAMCYNLVIALNRERLKNLRLSVKRRQKMRASLIEKHLEDLDILEDEDDDEDDDD